jgi:hypothetical protein
MAISKKKNSRATPHIIPRERITSPQAVMLFLKQASLELEWTPRDIESWANRGNIETVSKQLVLNTIRSARRFCTILWLEGSHYDSRTDTKLLGLEAQDLTSVS